MTGTKGLGNNGLGRLKQPAERCPEIPCGRVDGRIQIAFHVIDGALQEEDLIPECVQFSTRHDELVLRELEFGGALPCHPIPLTTGLGAETTWTTGPLTVRQRCAAPFATWTLVRRRFRHDETPTVNLRMVDMASASSPGGSSGSRALPPAPARILASDNVAGAHPQVMDALVRANAGHSLAYGRDDATRRAEQAFNELFGREVRTLFVYGGTGANVLALASLLRQAESVICTNWSHIHVDETGAPERILGAKLLDLACPNGKLTPQQIREAASARGNPHHAQPGVVSLTQPTELGTLYSPSEVREICDTAHELGLLVHMDAARIGNATAALGGDRVALRSFTVDAGVDVLSFGGTKAGIVFGEAVVWFDPRRADRAEYLRKNVTQLHSKMRFISAQYEALLADDLFITLGRMANDAARSLYDATRHHAGLGLTTAPAVNSLFPTLRDPVKTRLQEWSFFWDWDTAAHQVRWMTAWDVTTQDVVDFAAGVNAALAN